MLVLLFCFAVTATVSTAEGIIQLENVELLNGISIGATRNEVKQTIKNITHEDKKGISTKEKFAGYDNAGIWYVFDENDELVYVQVYFDYKPLKTKDQTNKEYLDVRHQLVDKYGKALGYTNDNFFAVTGKGIEEYLLLTNIGKFAISYSSAYDEWAIKLQNGYMKIEHFAVFQHGKKSDTATHALYYQFFTDKEWDDAMHGMK